MPCNHQPRRSPLFLRGPISKRAFKDQSLTSPIFPKKKKPPRICHLGEEEEGEKQEEGRKEGTYLSPGALSPNRQTIHVSSTAIGAHIPEAADVIAHAPAQFVFDRHRRQRARELLDLPVVEAADARGRVDVVARHHARRHVWADAIEGLEGSLQEEEEEGKREGMLVRLVGFERV